MRLTGFSDDELRCKWEGHGHVLVARSDLTILILSVMIFKAGLQSVCRNIQQQNNEPTKE